MTPSEALQDARYFIIETDEDEAICILDGWLEDWLYRKNHCPNCGMFDENDD